MDFFIPSLMESCLCLSASGLKGTEVPSCEESPQPPANAMEPTIITPIRNNVNPLPALLRKVQSFPLNARPTSAVRLSAENEQTTPTFRFFATSCDECAGAEPQEDNDDNRGSNPFNLNW